MLSAPIVNTSAPVLYPRARCLQLRRTCMMQARKHKDAGRKAVMLEWLGYALYWSTRARTGLAPDPAQAIAYTRGKRFAVRSPQDQRVTLNAAKAGMNPPGYVPGQDSASVPTSTATGV